MKHLLVATDFSETAAAALAHGAALARATGAKLTLIHVIYAEKISETLLGLDAMEYLTQVLNAPPEQSPYSPTLAAERLRATALQKLAEAAATAGGRRVAMETALAEGRPSDEILAFAAREAVDLIVLGTHGRGAIGKALIGSVADHVIRQADCPVMVVRK
ncbi:MAG: universal stress protein [Planctomycetaceae bacterium]|nr:universal stress protein [Planctomycetaceae bacterium]